LAQASAIATTSRAALRARVHGAGPTGSLAALALAEAGWQVQLHDPLTPEQLQARSRAYALTQSSRRLLQRLGLWDQLEPALVPFNRLHLQDQGCGAAVGFTPADLPVVASERPQGPIGWIARHGPLMAVLVERLQQQPAVELRLGAPESAAPLEFAPSQQGSSAAAHPAASRPAEPAAPPADLVVAADGPASPCREALGIRRWRLPYRQACLTVQLEVRGNDGREAWELLRPEGPFAVLPLAPDQVQLVWSAPTGRCQRLLELPDSALLERLAGLLPEPLEGEGLLDAPAAFPVALELARRLHRGNTLLVGESAHRCHPVGGQGLNLCWRDVEVLHQLATEVRQGRLPLARLGHRYGRSRWPDVVVTLLATDLIVRLFSNRLPLLLPLRRLGLGLLARSRSLRRLSLWVMSEGTGRFAA
jgi:2-octaprenyl-6-methoxyphenol hydroxylase